MSMQQLNKSHSSAALIFYQTLECYKTNLQQRNWVNYRKTVVFYYYPKLSTGKLESHLP